ncbi:MAG: hypothetical protein EOP48_05430 [Sphingobacteriales bacterium]|nr:MAG: hypothetical protein EOP48_05430 [Sphingobacteriales bacterium]
MVENPIPLILLSPQKNLLDNYLEWLSNAEHNSLINQDGTVDPDNLPAIEANIRELEEKYFNDAPADQITKVPPLEWHPYIKDELINPKYLLLGTFPPPSYLHNRYNWRERTKLQSIKIGSKPIVDYFYGNMASFWEILGIDFTGVGRDERLNKATSALSDKQFSISDIILCCQRNTLEDKEKSGSRSADTNLYNIIPNLPLLDKLLNYVQLERIVFTSADWGVQKKRKLKPNNSALSIFLQTILSLFDSVEVKLNTGIWVSLLDVEAHYKSIFCTAYTTNMKAITKTNKGLPADHSERKYSYPNFFKIRLSRNGQHKEIDILGLPSPSGNADRNVPNTVLYKQWSAYRNDQNEQDMTVETFRSDLYNLAFSSSSQDIDKLFQVQSTPLI